MINVQAALNPSMD